MDYHPTIDIRPRLDLPPGTTVLIILRSSWGAAVAGLRWLRDDVDILGFGGLKRLSLVSGGISGFVVHAKTAWQSDHEMTIRGMKS